jgi:putative CocE/NonD family hydrolase
VENRLDPAEWVPRGYAIVNIDPRGVGDSEGDIRWWGTAEGRDGHDAIEDLVKLPWSNGKVGMAGNSWLAISQYFIAAEQPPHLLAIAPLEGASDCIREESLRGDIPWTTFTNSIAEMLQGRSVRAFLSFVINSSQGRQQQEDLAAMIRTCTTVNDYLQDKRADFSNIKVPAYIGASYSSDIHGIGSLRAFEEMKHNNKW